MGQVFSESAEDPQASTPTQSTNEKKKSDSPQDSATVMGASSMESDETATLDEHVTAQPQAATKGNEGSFAALDDWQQVDDDSSRTSAARDTISGEATELSEQVQTPRPAGTYGSQDTSPSTTPSRPEGLSSTTTPTTSTPASHEASYAVLSLAEATHLHASWSNTDREDLLGLTTASPGFAARPYDSLNLNESRSRTPTPTPSRHSRIPSIGETSQLASSFTNANTGLLVDPVSAPPPTVSSAIHDAARITNWRSVKDLCASEPEAARYVGRDNWTALHHACNRRCPHPEVVEALIRAYPEALLLEEDKGWLPLHYACRFKCIKEVVRLLLHLYPEMGQKGVVKLDKQGRTPLYYAVRYDAPHGVVGLLLDVDASAVLEEDQNADSPLALVWDAWAEKLDGKRTLQRICAPNTDSASHEDHAVVVQKRLASQSRVMQKWNKVNMFLKAAFGFSVEDEDESTDIFHSSRDSSKTSAERKWRVLHAASAIKCHPRLFLLALGLHPEQAFELDRKDLIGPNHVCCGCQASSERTALHFAASSHANGDVGKLVVTQLLFLNSQAAEKTDSCGKHPLHVAAGNRSKKNWGHDGVQEIYLANEPAVETPDLIGRLPLHHAAATIVHEDATNESITEMSIICNLLEVHIDAAGHADHFGRLPLHDVAGNGERWDVQVQMLYDAHPQAIRERSGVKLLNRLPLHLAANNPKAQASLVCKFVELHPRGAAQSDRSGKLPIHLACESGQSWDAVQSIIGAFPDALRQPEGNDRGWLALHMAAACPTSSLALLTNLVLHYPKVAGIADQKGRCPLHLACLAGKNWRGGLSVLFNAAPDVIGTQDNIGLLPFVIACFRYSTSPDKDVLKRPASVTSGERKFSKCVAGTEGLGKESDADDARRVGNLFQLLKADPTVLHLH